MNNENISKTEEDIENMFKNYIRKVIEHTKMEYDKARNEVMTYETVTDIGMEEFTKLVDYNSSVHAIPEEILIKSYRDIENLFSNDKLFVIIKGLPPRHKQILYLKYVEDKTDEEIAQKMGVKRQAITKTRNQALQMIMENYTE